MNESIILAPTISCDHCKRTIEAAVGRLEGVESVSVDVEQKRVSVRFEGAVVAHEAIVAAIEEAGYEVAEPAPPVASRGCCG